MFGHGIEQTKHEFNNEKGEELSREKNSQMLLEPQILYVPEVKHLFWHLFLSPSLTHPDVCWMVCVWMRKWHTERLWDFDTWTNLIWWLTFTDDNSILGFPFRSPVFRICACVLTSGTPAKLVASCSSVCTSLWYVLMVVCAYFPF